MASFPSPRTRHELTLRRDSLRGGCTVTATAAAPSLGPASPERDAAAAANSDLEAPLLLAPSAAADAGASSSAALEPPEAAESDNNDPALRRRLDRAYAVSWVVNILLMAAKAYAYWASSSKAVLASAADSAVDLASQAVIAWADVKARKPDPRFPVGAARFELVGVLVCACVMSGASYAVVAESASVLYRGFRLGELPATDFGGAMYAVLLAATALKGLCYLQCASLRGRSDAMVALSEDHLNDIASNLMAVLTALLSQCVWPAWLPGRDGSGAAGGAAAAPRLWFVDPLGAILISLWIVARWLSIFKDAVDKLCGRNAPEEFYQQLHTLAQEHHPSMALDVIRAYAFGARYLVEVEVIMPEETVLKITHDLALQLQHRIEALEDCERAFVHVDYERRSALEHKAERALFRDRAGQEAAMMAAQRSGSLGGSNGGGRSGGVGGGG
jgi:divalent metal cation (Fe/Co/Zn/Cd) transporter